MARLMADKDTLTPIFSSQSSQWRSKVASSFASSWLHRSPSSSGVARMRRLLPVEIPGERSLPSLLIFSQRLRVVREMEKISTTSLLGMPQSTAARALILMSSGSLYRDQDLVFAGEGGNPINPSNLRNRSFKPLLERAGLPRITFHDLRHTCASLLFQRNVHPKFVQELLGHASVAITLDTYSHMLPGMGGEAADAIGEALG